MTLRVVYIAGWMRSGSTLLAELVGSLPGALAVGELSGVWDAARHNKLCSCGRQVTACEVWAPAIGAVHDEHGIGVNDYERLHELTSRVLSTRTLLPRSGHAERSASTRSTDAARYAAVTGTLLRAIRKVSGQSVLVDSSKKPAGVPALASIPGVQVDCLHIVRDPRAVAWSELKTLRADPLTDVAPPGRGLLSSAAHWSVFNVLCRSVGSRRARYAWLTYESMTRDPRRALGDIAAFLRLPASALPEWSTDGTLALAESHVLTGNPSRLAGRVRVVAPDVAWRDGLSRSQRATVVVLTAPARCALGLSRRRVRGIAA